MKMAKANKYDMDMAMDLCNALESLTGRWEKLVPEEIAKPRDEREEFDLYDNEQCRRVLGYLLELAERGSLMRVVFGYAVMIDPANKIVDPDADTLEHHPRRQQLEQQMEAVNELFESGDWSVTRGDGRMTLPYEQTEKVAEDVEKLVQENEA